MYRLLILFCLLMSQASFVYAQETSGANVENINTEQNVPKQMAEIKEQEDLTKTEETLQDKIDALAIEEKASDEKAPEMEIIHQVEVIPVVLPECNDAKLLEKTKKFITSYYDKIQNASTLYRRQRYFVLKGLDNFKKENIADYKTTKAGYVADVLADIRINHQIADENILLCKNISKDKFASEVYMIVYPENNHFRVQLVNLYKKQSDLEQSSFTY